MEKSDTIQITEDNVFDVAEKIIESYFDKNMFIDGILWRTIIGILKEKVDNSSNSKQEAKE